MRESYTFIARGCFDLEVDFGLYDACLIVYLFVDLGGWGGLVARGRFQCACSII